VAGKAANIGLYKAYSNLSHLNPIYV